MKKKTLLNIFIMLSVMASGCISLEFVGNSYSVHEVTEVVDGDTVKINSSSGEETVRLVGTNTPETYGENNPGYFDLEDSEENRDCLRNMGEKATYYMEETVENRTVKVKRDSIEDDEGSYGRKLRYIIVEEEPVGKKLIEKGYANVYPTEFTYRQEFLEAERKAIEQGIGVWAC